MPSQAYSERLGAIFGLVFFSVAGALLADVSKDQNHKYLYNPLTVPPLVELTKAVISCGVWLRTSRQSLKALNTASFMLFSVPAACYFVSNSCMFFIVQDLGLNQFQILSTIKLFFTAYLMRIFLGRTLNKIQIFSLLILAAGIVLTQLQSGLSGLTHVRVRGYMLVILSCVSSSVGGVYNEKLLKCCADGGNIHYKNIQLYTWGFAFGMISWTLTNPLATLPTFFSGYNVIVCAMVLVLSLSGISVSYLLKYTDSLVKSMVTALAIAVTTCIQIFRGIEELSFSLISGILLISQALRLYSS